MSTDAMMFQADASRVLIPLFQRRYCWNHKLISGWFSDTIAGKRYSVVEMGDNIQTNQGGFTDRRCGK